MAFPPEPEIFQLGDGMLQSTKGIPAMNQVNLFGNWLQHQCHINRRIAAAQHCHALIGKIRLIADKIAHLSSLQLVCAINASLRGEKAPLPNAITTALE